MANKVLSEQEIRQKVADHLMDDVMDAHLMVKDVPLFLDHVDSLIAAYGDQRELAGRVDELNRASLKEYNSDDSLLGITYVKVRLAELKTDSAIRILNKFADGKAQQEAQE